MRRGDIVTVSAPGDYGKPRLAVIIQADAFLQAHDSVVVCLCTSFQSNAPLFRIPLEPTEENGLQEHSDIMVDKLITMQRTKIGKKIGELDTETIKNLNRSILLFYGLA